MHKSFLSSAFFLFITLSHQLEQQVARSVAESQYFFWAESTLSQKLSQPVWVFLHPFTDEHSGFFGGAFFVSYSLCDFCLQAQAYLSNPNASVLFVRPSADWGNIFVEKHHKVPTKPAVLFPFPAAVLCFYWNRQWRGWEGGTWAETRESGSGGIWPEAGSTAAPTPPCGRLYLINWITHFNLPVTGFWARPPLLKNTSIMPAAPPCDSILYSFSIRFFLHL